MLYSAFAMPELTPDETNNVHKLFDSAFRGYGQARLAKLPLHVLDALVRNCSSPTARPDGTDPSTEAVAQPSGRGADAVAARAMETAVTPAPPPATDEPVPTIPKEPPPPPPPPAAATKIVRPVFKPQHELNIIAFNSLKLRLDRKSCRTSGTLPSSRPRRRAHAQRVRASDNRPISVARLVEMLNDCTDEQWTWCL